MQEEYSKHLVSTKKITNSIVWNIVGLSAPLFVGIFSIPFLIESYGEEKFGLLALIWLGVGYFSLFDMGMGRTLTKIVSQHIAKGDKTDINLILGNAFQLLVGLSMIGGLILAFSTEFIAREVLKDGDLILIKDAVESLSILAIGIPIIIISAGLVGVLEAHQKFKHIAKIRILLGLSTFLAPLITVQFDTRIFIATACLLAIRLMGLLAYYKICASLYPEFRFNTPINISIIKSFISYSGWLTVSNIIGPLMTTMDRFFISARLGLSNLTFYVTPYEMLSRLQFIPQSVIAVLFPAMTSAHEQKNKRLLDIFKYGGNFLFWIMLPLMFFIFLFAQNILDFWLGSQFKTNSTVVVKWLCVGWIINVLALPAYTAIQAIGRSDLTAKIHMIELPVYVFLLWFFTDQNGINGVAMAWTFRVVIDAVILNIIVHRKIEILQSQAKIIMISIISTLFLFAITSRIENDVVKVLTMSLVFSFVIIKNYTLIKTVLSR
jgi:O-antigen/teichoic acid export membrane protein